MAWQVPAQGVQVYQGRAVLILISEGNTEVACKIAEEGMATLLRLFFLR